LTYLDIINFNYMVVFTLVWVKFLTYTWINWYHISCHVLWSYLYHINLVLYHGFRAPTCFSHMAYFYFNMVYCYNIFTWSLSYYLHGLIMFIICLTLGSSFTDLVHVYFFGYHVLWFFHCLSICCDYICSF